MAYSFERWLSFACAAGFALTACDSDDADPEARDPNVEMREVELTFEARVGGDAVSCEQRFSGLGSDQRALYFADFRFYIYDVELIDKSGKRVALEVPDDGKFQSQGVVLLDFEDRSGHCQNGSKETNAAVRGKVPVGSYDGIAFRIGMPPEINHGNPALQKPPLSVQALSWNWLQGHKFMRIDVDVEADGADPQHGLEAHLGATGCSGRQGAYECTNENSPSVALDSFDPEADKVVFDFAKLIAGLELGSEREGSDLPGCISDVDDPDCGPMFEALGLDLATGKASSKPQTVFSIEAR